MKPLSNPLWCCAMQRLRTRLDVTGIAAALLASTTIEVGFADPGTNSFSLNNYGFFIGVNGTHLASQLKEKDRLKYAPNDAVEFAWRYVQELGLIPATNAYIFLDGPLPVEDHESEHKRRVLQRNGVFVCNNATEQAFRDGWAELLRKACREAGPSSFILTFASGHGFETNDVPYLLVPPGHPEATGQISLKDMATSMARLPAESIRLLIIDACRSSTFPGALKSGQPQEGKDNDSFLAALHRLSGGWVVFSSCSSKERSREFDKERHGLFTWRFLEHARGASIRSASLVVTLNDIVTAVADDVRARAIAGWSETQTPTVDAQSHALAMPVGISPYAPFMQKRMEQRWKNAAQFLDRCENGAFLPKEITRPMRAVLRMRDLESQELLITHLEMLGAEMSSENLAALTNWWPEFFASAKARDSDAVVSKLSHLRVPRVVYYVTSETNDHFGVAITKRLEVEAATNVTASLRKITSSSIASLEAIIKPPPDLRFVSEGTADVTVARYRNERLFQFELNEADRADYALRVEPSSPPKANLYRPVYRATWTLVSTLTGETVTSEFAAAPPHAKHATESSGPPLTHKGSLTTWDTLGDEAQMELLNSVFSSLEYQLNAFLSGP